MVNERLRLPWNRAPQLARKEPATTFVPLRDDWGNSTIDPTRFAKHGKRFEYFSE
jgi:hypothetical protein